MCSFWSWITDIWGALYDLFTFISLKFSIRKKNTMFKSQIVTKHLVKQNKQIQCPTGYLLVVISRTLQNIPNWTHYHSDYHPPNVFFLLYFLFWFSRSTVYVYLVPKIKSCNRGWLSFSFTDWVPTLSPNRSRKLSDFQIILNTFVLHLYCHFLCTHSNIIINILTDHPTLPLLQTPHTAAVIRFAGYKDHFGKSTYLPVL